LRGLDAVSRAWRKLEGHENEPPARQKYADVLARAGRHAEALQEYLWCFDKGRGAPGYSGVRLTILLQKIERLSAKTPDARKALEQRRDAAEVKLLANAKDYDAVVDFVALDTALGETRRTLATYLRLKKTAPLDPKVREVFARELTPLLVAERQYAEALELIGDPSVRVTKTLEDFTAFKKTVERQAEVKPEMAQALQTWRSKTLLDCARVFEACLGVGRKDEAAQLAQKIAAFGMDGATHAMLVASAARAGAKDVARSLGERALAILADKEAGVVRTALDALSAVT
jgi:hypothetical protein